MKCLVLAAGFGTRLRGASESKPLTPLAGVPLIEHVITRAAAAGAREFVVVTGHQADRVEAFLATLRAQRGLRLECVRASDFGRPNGFSVLDGAATIAGDYLLLMSDHLFDPEIAQRLIEGRSPSVGLTLAVDRRLGGALLDLDDATKVDVAEDGAIRRIGKTLTCFNAIDTGVFLATPALAEALRADIAAGGGGSLSEGVQRLADAGQAQTMDIGSARWIDVDDPRMLRLAETLVAPDRLRDSAA